LIARPLDHLQLIDSSSSSFPSRADWTSAFNLNITKYFCLGNLSTTQLLWLQLATPLMYFVFWLVLFVAHWTRKSSQKRGVARPLSSGSSDLRMSLMSHLLENEQEEQEQEESSTDDQPHHSENNLQRYCKRFRFLRALEFLLLFSFETLTEQALQLTNCVSVGACASRVLAEYPDISCTNNGSFVPLLVIAIFILIYAALFPVLLFRFLRNLPRDKEDGEGQVGGRVSVCVGAFVLALAPQPLGCRRCRRAAITVIRRAISSLPSTAFSTITSSRDTGGGRFR
jgi:hypothetical protein